MTDRIDVFGSGGKGGSSKKVFVFLLKETCAIMLLSFLLILLLNANIMLRSDIHLVIMRHQTQG